MFELAIERKFSFGCTVVVKPQGVKAFLYGNDLLICSAERFCSQLRRGCRGCFRWGGYRVVGAGYGSSNFNKYVEEGKMLMLVVENVLI